VSGGILVSWTDRTNINSNTDFVVDSFEIQVSEHLICANVSVEATALLAHTYSADVLDHSDVSLIQQRDVMLHLPTTAHFRVWRVHTLVSASDQVSQSLI
jgi:hypothetical protein